MGRSEEEPTQSPIALVAGASLALAGTAFAQDGEPLTVTVGNFIRAETDFYFKTRLAVSCLAPAFQLSVCHFAA
jgi:hypothetical protein